MERFLDGEVPLLGVTRSAVPLHAENSLPQSRVRVGSRRLHSRTGRESECRIDVVRRLLPNSLYEWKLRKGERGRDARLLEEDHPVAGADHQSVSDTPGQADPRSEVEPLHL